MVIFDKLSYESQKGLLSTLKANKIKVDVISNVDAAKREEYAVLVCTITKCFFNTDAFEFLRSQLTYKSLSIILLAEANVHGNLENSSIATAWAHALIGPRRKDYQVVSTIDARDTDYAFSVIDSLINPREEEPLNKVIIYTDGACAGNPGVGGWGTIVIANGKATEMSGSDAGSTNNRMEILAAIKGLETLKTPSDVVIYSDSAYLVNAFTHGWLEQWKNNRWKNSDKVLVKNPDLWQQLDALTQMHKVEFCKVKGHANDKYNNRCDELAVMEAKKLKKQLEEQE